MKISVIMIDGGFRENVFSARYFSEQDFPADDYEILWVEYFDKVHNALPACPRVRSITLNRSGEYHSSYCFNRGIESAKGELLIIPDADQIVRPDFLTTVWNCHQLFEKLVMYIYRFDETVEKRLNNYDFDELEKKCILKNPANYGGCLTIRKKWLIEMNGYEMHEIMSSGFHANGMDIAVRSKNLGLAIQWHPTLKLFHPYHSQTLEPAWQYKVQHKLIEWRKNNRIYQTIRGINPEKNLNPPQSLLKQLEQEMVSERSKNRNSFIQRMKRYLKKYYTLS